MRITIEIKSNVHEHEDIFKKILDALKAATIPRDMNGSKVYLENCYFSKSLFNRLSCNSKKFSDHELAWFSVSRRSVYQIIFDLESKSNVEYYNIKLITDGNTVTYFAGVSGISYFFMDDGEKISFLG